MLKKYPLALYITWIVALAVIPLPLIVLMNSQLIADPVNLFAYDMGILAYVWWLVIIFLSTRPKWLEKYIGIPSMYFVHASLGIAAIIAATAHKFLSFSFDQPVKTTGNIAWYLAIIGIIYAIVFMSGWLVDRFNVIRQIKLKLSKIFTHQVSIWIHRLNLLLILLIWLHVHLIVRFSRMTIFMTTFDAYTYIIIGYYLLSKFITLFKTNGTVVVNKQIAPHTQQIVIKLDENDPSYQAGDFYFVSFRNSKSIGREKHPFSVTSAPKNNPHEVTFTIQKLGDFTKKIPSVRIGTRVYLEGPYGQFDRVIRKLPQKQPLIFYGLGSGLAPLLSLAEEYGDQRQIKILWSSSQNNGLYFEKDLEKLKKNPNITVIAREGRFTEELMKNELSAKEIDRGMYFIVGPAHVILNVEKMLRKLNIKSSHIIDERLTM
ncbi:oxidoreductase [Lactobacillus reuteri]|uniref:Oxidoreductase n=1 Tax=Limosilactobacillus reuteri TaxID=1598 RepID=A0A7X2G430_LIMRT|nr:oxidoreductase [Limosilactobacillus reuteri]MRH72011.1 oxidoreductase [Limosilactobacillus reuteri]MRH79996.1 oxidoreductase [Limosilactobacillus reuteri]